MKLNFALSALALALVLSFGCEKNQFNNSLAEEIQIQETVSQTPTNLPGVSAAGYTILQAPEGYQQASITAEMKKSSTCPPDFDYFCNSNYTGSLGCFDQDGSDDLTTTFNFQFLNKFCRERFVNSSGAPIAIQNNQLGQSVNVIIVKEEINHPMCPDYTGYNVFPSDDCVNVSEAYTILDDIVAAAQVFRPSSATGFYLLDKIFVFYFEEIECDPGEACMSTYCLDPCYCDNKRMVVRLTYKENLVGQCGTAGS